MESESLAAAAKRAGLDKETIENCLKIINDASVKKMLAQATEDALKHGVNILAQNSKIAPHI